MDKVVKLLADKYNLSEDIVEKVIRSEFGFVANTMSEGKYKSVRLHYLGIWGVKPKRLEQLQKNNNGSKE